MNLILIILLCSISILLLDQKENFDILSDIKNLGNKVKDFESKISNFPNTIRTDVINPIIKPIKNTVDQFPKTIKDKVVNPAINPIKDTLKKLPETIKKTIIDPALKPLIALIIMLKNISFS